MAYLPGMGSSLQPLRTLPPAGGQPRPFALLRRFMEQEGHEAAVELGLKELFQGKPLTFTSSGKEALRILFSKVYPEQEVLVAAYTCPDLVASAVRAGSTVRLLDVDPRTLEPQPDPSLESKSRVLVLSNLYGLPDQLDPWINTPSLTVVDDACQAALSRHIGARTDWGVLSFGRGKALGVGGGGAIVGGTPGFTPIVPFSNKEAVKYFALALLESPWLYSIPASLPFLGLGKTVYELDFHANPVSRTLFAALHAKLETLEETRAAFLERAKWWADSLERIALIQPFIERGLRFDASVIPIRYPALVRDESKRDSLLAVLKRYGVNGSYPASLRKLCAGETRLIASDTPGADEVARRIFTLPTHRWVTYADVKCISRKLEDILGTV